jgi:hypothetical protein
MTTTANEGDAKTFFDSFKFQDFKVTDEYEVYTDTTLFYSAETIIPEELPDMPSRRRQGSDEGEENTDYLDSKATNYPHLAKTGESIYV